MCDYPKDMHDHDKPIILWNYAYTVMHKGMHVCTPKLLFFFMIDGHLCRGHTRLLMPCKLEHR